MIDIHSHILPQLDDGSRSVEESIKMLGMLSKQGVDTVVATPHFYINSIDIDEFFDKREKSAEILKKEIGNISRPKITIGAEVEFYPELYTLKRLDELCIGGSKYILLEMPFSRWNSYTFKGLENLYIYHGITPVIAHIERYFAFHNIREFMDSLGRINVLNQMNFEFLIGRLSRNKGVSLIKKGQISFLGTDAHRIDDRSPNAQKGFSILEKRLEKAEMQNLLYWENKLTQNIKNFL